MGFGDNVVADLSCLRFCNWLTVLDPIPMRENTGYWRQALQHYPRMSLGGSPIYRDLGATSVVIDLDSGI